jgi:Flp pilus assembly protein TadD
MGWVYLDIEQAHNAITTFNRVVARSSGYAEAHMGLAIAYEQRNMKRDAIKHYRIFIELDPGSTEARVARRKLEQLQ